MILDIGPAAVEALADVLKTCRTLVWNGPLGAFETPPFDAATVALAQTAAALTKEGSLVSVAGGGDTVAALNHAGVADDFTFVSTAGGAFLEWMEGRTLPGVAALEQQLMVNIEKLRPCRAAPFAIVEHDDCAMLLTSTCSRSPSRSGEAIEGHEIELGGWLEPAPRRRRAADASCVDPSTSGTRPEAGARERLRQ